MASVHAAPPGLQISEEELGRLLALADDADSVELKLTVPEADQRSAVTALGMDPLDAQIRQVFFFDTPDLALYEAGVVARARRVQKRGDDSVVKLRPVVPSELPDEVRRSPNMVVEVDAMPGGFVCSASLKRSMGPDGRESLHDGRAQAAQAVLQGAARILRRARARRDRHRRSHHPRAHLRAEAEALTSRLRSPVGGRDVDVSRQHPDPRAVHEVRAGRGARRGSPRKDVPDRPGRRGDRRAADEDADGARVLRRQDYRKAR